MVQRSARMRDVIFANLVTLQTVNAAANGSQPLDPWQLVLDAGPVVKLVLLLLVGMSLGCWFIIGAKLVRFGQATRHSQRFLELFWHSDPPQWGAERLEAVYGQLAAYKASPLANVFRAGYVELARATAQPANPGQPAGGLDNIERALRRAAGNELTGLETMLPFLATTGSVAPFVGLFGTVWGIMNSFISIHGQKSASLDVVAPGIAEALIATAIGLAAAIPAVMAYNYFIRRIRVLESELDSFSSDYLNIVRRYFLHR